MDKAKRHRLGRLSAVAIAALICLIAFSAAASAAAPEFLGRIGGDAGSGAGQLSNPIGVATDAGNGHVFVADTGNNRIGEFTPWGEFVKAWGWGVANGAAELQACGPGATPPSATCLSGLAGAGAGQLDTPQGIDVDSSGNVYVLEQRNSRVQKFSAAGEFLWMVGGGVDQGPNHPGNLCTAAFEEEGDVCGAGSLGSGPREFGVPLVVGVDGDHLAIGPDDTVYVGDKGRVQKLGADGSHLGELALPESEKPASTVGDLPGALDVDPETGNLYFSFRQAALEQDQPPNVYKLSPAGALLAPPFPLRVPLAIAADADGNAFVAHDLFQFNSEETFESEVVEFDPAGSPLIPLGSEFATPPDLGFLNRIRLQGLATNGIGDLLVSNHSQGAQLSYVDIYGPPPLVYEDPPEVPPTIADQYAVSVAGTEAVVRAAINPHYWTDTRYHVEYGTAECATGPCQARPTPPGSILTGAATAVPVTSAGVFLQGLQPGTTYHYRFVASSSGGGPAFGQDRTFTTPPLPVAPKGDCANQSLRAGDATRLADCRAYEMVSPVDKNGADVDVTFTVIGDPAGRDQSSRSGARIAYSSQKAFGEVEGAPYSSQYLATRGAAGWATESISPPRAGPSINTFAGLDSQYKAFSADLSSGWLVQDTDLSLAPGSVPGYPNLYRRDNATGAYEALTTSAPSSIPAAELVLELQGTSADGSRAFFRANDALTEEGTKGRTQLYEAFDGELRLVCVGPSGVPSKKDCTAGSPEASAGVDHGVSLSHAISDDGSVVYWSDGATSNLGKLMARVGGGETVAVSVGAAARFWTAAADGSTAFYTEADKLLEFDLEDRTRTEVAGGVVGLMGASEDASRVYFASTQALDEGAQAGEPNVYLYEAEAGFAYVATLADADVSGLRISPVSPRPTHRTSRVAPDGGHVAFMSSGSLTGFDTIDVESGEPAAEVYLYDAAAEELRCVSCLASGARPSGRDVVPSASEAFWVAARIPPFTDQLYAPRVLADDGSRLFFESFDPLVHGDTNGKQDVYEWEEAGAGSCESGGFGYRPDLDGCVTLISSGKSPQDSRFVDASADGGDVFFKTASSLVPQDPGLIDIYDARVGGGYPPPPSPPQLCEGEACQPTSAPPAAPTPASSSFEGPGDRAAGRPRAKRCTKAQRRAARRGKPRKGRCARRGAKAGARGRAAR